MVEVRLAWILQQHKQTKYKKLVFYFSMQTKLNQIQNASIYNAAE